MKIAADSLSDGELFARVAATIHEVAGTPLGSVAPESRIGEDLGVWGDDGIDLLEVLDNQFVMDWSGIEPGLHFGDEVQAHPWKVQESAAWFERQPLTVGALMEALRAGRWPEIARIERPPASRARLRVASWAMFLFAGGLCLTILAVVLIRLLGS
jgi:hypothetical protein